MNKRKISFALLVFMLCPIILMGTSSDTRYFTLFYQYKGATHRIEVSERSLTPAWHDIESKLQFTKRKSMYERAASADVTVKNNFPELWRIVSDLEEKLHIPKNDGQINFNPYLPQKFWVTGQSTGQQLDVEKLSAEMLGSLKNKKHMDIVAVVNPINPTSPEGMLDKIVVRSSFSTNFEDNEPRECNIALALGAFNGLVVQPNETVSFNEVVGRRTRERGYKEAKIIMDGEFVPGVGGGVCQASTTIFNAVLLSGLKIMESHPHSLAISYVPLGRDAMVSSRSDLRFKNTTSLPIYICTKFIDRKGTNTATVTIYGDAPKYKYKPRSEVKTKDMIVEICGDVPVLMNGLCFVTGNEWYYEQIILQSGRAEKVARTYLDVYCGDKLIESKYIRTSRYKGKPKIVTYKKVEKQSQV